MRGNKGRNNYMKLSTEEFRLGSITVGDGVAGCIIDRPLEEGRDGGRE